MAHDLIFDHISRHINLDLREKEYFSSLLLTRQIRRRQAHLKEGEICKYSAFVMQGCLRAFGIDKNGFEHVLSFAPPGWWIADMHSLLFQQPATLNIDALEDTEVLLLPKTSQETLYREVPKFERFFRVITENSLVTSQHRLLEILSLTAEERYLSFCTRYPTLIDCLPQKQVASYIGITPEFLSKLRHSLLKKR